LTFSFEGELIMASTTKAEIRRIWRMLLLLNVWQGCELRYNSASGGNILGPIKSVRAHYRKDNGLVLIFLLEWAAEHYPGEGWKFWKHNHEFALQVNEWSFPEVSLCNGIMVSRAISGTQLCEDIFIRPFRSLALMRALSTAAKRAPEEVVSRATPRSFSSPFRPATCRAFAFLKILAQFPDHPILSGRT
jgi:hypothetical protein